MALDHRGLPYETRLVNRATQEQSGTAFRQLNPNGQIPVLETPQGPLFETGAILLWLADAHGGLGPAPDDPERAAFLKWLFFAANTLHPALRMIFYPDKYIADGYTEVLREGQREHLTRQFATIDRIAQDRPPWLGGENPGILDFYLVAMLRWAAIYPSMAEARWFDLARYPALRNICARVEALPCCTLLKNAEGLGTSPFTDPHPPNPPEGSAL
jgi:glutathione S-transferase